MPVSRLGVPQPAGNLEDLPAQRGPSAPELRSLEGATGPGQAFADLLLLASLACQTPVSLLSVLQPGGTWSTLSHGFETRAGLNDGRLFEVIAGSSQPVELADLMGRVPRSPLVQPPHSMRWAYGVAIRDAAGSVTAVVAVMDRWLRQLTKREQKALAAVARQLGQQLSQLRRPGASEDRPLLHRVGPPRVGAASHPSRSSGLVSDPPQLLRSHEVATIFDVTERTVINWAAAGKLPSLRTIGGHLRFRRDDVMNLLSGAQEAAER
jgi:excisionase family DNA binding protein